MISSDTTEQQLKGSVMASAVQPRRTDLTTGGAAPPVI
jgi:hypothetical protein